MKETEVDSKVAYSGHRTEQRIQPRVLKLLLLFQDVLKRPVNVRPNSTVAWLQQISNRD
jgi:hypothetical protein